MKRETCNALCYLVDRHAPALAAAVDELDEAEAEWVFETIGSAAARVLSYVWQKRVDQSGGV